MLSQCGQFVGCALNAFVLASAHGEREFVEFGVGTNDDEMGMDRVQSRVQFARGKMSAAAHIDGHFAECLGTVECVVDEWTPGDHRWFRRFTENSERNDCAKLSHIRRRDKRRKLAALCVEVRAGLRRRLIALT